jgi:hypothetical protein
MFRSRWRMAAWVWAWPGYRQAQVAAALEAEGRHDWSAQEPSSSNALGDTPFSGR